MDKLRIAAAAAHTLAERRTGDPLWTWEPTAPQARYLGSQAAECWFLAANRSGKSDALAAWMAQLLRFGHASPRPASIGPGAWIFDRAVSLWGVSLTFEMGRDILEPKLFDNGYVPAGQPHAPFIPPHEIAHWSATSGVLRLKNGSLAGFKSADQGRDRFQGGGRDGIGFDEAPPFAIYEECTLRVEAGRKLWIRGAATLLPPEGTAGGVSWIFAKKIDPWLRGERTDLELIKASIYDNPHVLPSEIQRLESLYPAGSLERRIRLHGEWLPQITGQLAYGNFHRGIHVNPALGPAQVDFRLPLLIGFDANVAPLAAVIVQQIGPMYHQLDEVAIDLGTIKSLGEAIRHRYPAHGAALHIFGDATATAKRAQTARSDYELFLEAFEGAPYPLELYVPAKNPATRDRINAANWILKGPGGQVRYAVAPHCVETIADWEQVQLDSHGQLKKSHDTHDPYYRRTHWSDAAGYIFAYRDPVVAGQRWTPPKRGRSIPTPGYFRRP